MSEYVKPTVVVTGGGRRVGRLISETLAAADFRIAVHYRTSQAEALQTASRINSVGGEASAFQADLAEEIEVRRLFDAVMQRFGRIDGLVCSAASWLEKSLETTGPADLRAEFDANTLGPFLCAKECGLRMVEQPDGGAIVFVADWAIGRPVLDRSAYLTTKGALPTMTRSFARELAERNRNIRVNCVLPGPVLSADDANEDLIEANRRRTLLHRVNQPEWLAHAIAFLLTNPFITGVVLPVDAGRTIYSPGDGPE